MSAPEPRPQGTKRHLALVPEPPDELGPDLISRTLDRLERVGLPVIGVGIPNIAGSLCPLCDAGMWVDFGRPGVVSMTCVAGCDEDDIGIALTKGAR